MRSFWSASLRHLIFDFFATTKILKMVWILVFQMQILPKGNLNESHHWLGMVLFAQNSAQFLTLPKSFDIEYRFRDDCLTGGKNQRCVVFEARHYVILFSIFFATRKILKMLWILVSEMQSLPKGSLIESCHWFGCVCLLKIQLNF